MLCLPRSAVRKALDNGFAVRFGALLTNGESRAVSVTAWASVPALLFVTTASRWSALTRKAWERSRVAASPAQTTGTLRSRSTSSATTFMVTKG